MSDSDKLAAILKMADPQSNSSYQERKVALNKAHEIMDKTGMSYASVGMSQSDAERIETQFSVAIGGNQRKEKASADKFVKNATVIMVLFFIGFLFWVFSQIGAT